MIEINIQTTTQDLWLASYAWYNGFKLIDLRELGDRKLFVFEDSDEFQLMKRDYYWHRGQVDRLRLKKAIRELKALTMEG